MAQSYDRFKKVFLLSLFTVFALFVGTSFLFVSAAPVGGGEIIPIDSPPPPPPLEPVAGPPPPVPLAVPNTPTITPNTRALGSCMMNFEWEQIGPGTREFQTSWSVDNFVSTAGSENISAVFGDPDLEGVFSIQESTGIIPANTYWFRVKSCNSSGCSPYVKTNPAITTPPLTPPSAVPTITYAQGERAVALGEQDIEIGWEMPPGSVSDFGGFSIERSTNGGSFSPIISQPLIEGVPQPLWVRDLHRLDTNYYSYRIRAYDTAEGCSPVIPGSPESGSTNLLKYSAYSNVVTVPKPPSGVAAIAGDNEIVISWNDNSTNETMFILERSVYSDFPVGGVTVFPEFSANTLTYTDTEVTTGHYYYRIKACTALTVCSRVAKSAVVQVGSIKPELAARILYVSTSTSRASVLFTWKEIEEVYVDGYRLEESTNSSFDSPLLIGEFSAGGIARYLHKDQPLRQMYYRLVGYDKDGSGEIINEWFSDVVPLNLAITNVFSGQTWSSFRVTAAPGDIHGVGYANFNVDSEVDPQRQISPPPRIEYSVQSDNAGLVSGFAWTSAPPGPVGVRHGFGWITFNKIDLTGCPTAPCEARFSTTANRMWGWARFYSSIVALADDPALPVTSGWIYLGAPGALPPPPPPPPPDDLPEEGNLGASSPVASLLDVRGTVTSLASLIRSVFAAPDVFNFAISAPARTVTQGNSITNSVVASRSSGIPAIDGPVVVFTATGLPAGVIASFSPTGCLPTCSTIMNINVGAAVTPGAYTVGITGTYGALVRSTTFQLTIVASGGGGEVGGVFNFSLSASARTVSQGNSTTNSIVVSRLDGTAENVLLSVSGLPSGVTGTLGLPSCLPTCSVVLSIAVGASVPPATYPITITGTAGALTKSTTFNLIIVASGGGGGGGAFDFSLSASGRTVSQGNSVSNSVVASRISGTSEQVTFSISGLPSGVTASFLPVAGCLPTCVEVITFNTTLTATVGTHEIIVTGVSGAITHEKKFNLTIVGGGVGGAAIVNIAYDVPTKTLVGAAWGGNVLGWLAFSKPECSGLCTVRVEETVPSSVLPVDNVLIQEGTFIEAGLSGPVWCSYTPYYNLYWDYNGPVALAQAEIAIVDNGGNVHFSRTLTPSDLVVSGGTRYKYEMNDPLGYTDTGVYGGAGYLDPNTVYRLRVRVQDTSGTWTHLSSDPSTWARSPDTATPAHYAPFLDSVTWSPDPVISGSAAYFSAEGTIDRSEGSSPESGWSWLWSFTGGSPPMANTKNASTIYGTSPISITVTDPVISMACKFTASPPECIVGVDPDCFETTERIKRRVIRER